jgi:hypothetical protein
VRWICLHEKDDVQHISQGGNQDLQELYLYKLREFQPYHLVFIDESGCDKRAGLQRSGRATLGVAPVQVTGLHPGTEKRYLSCKEVRK